MERDINVVVRIKEDGTMSFVSGDGLPLKIGGGEGGKLYLHNISLNNSGNYVKVISTDSTAYTSTSIFGKDFIFVSGKYEAHYMLAFSSVEGENRIAVAYSDNQGGVEYDRWDDVYFMDMQDTVTEL